MVVCRFWEKGNCRNGDNCRFEHPGSRSSNQGRAPFDNGNRNDSRSQPRNPFDASREEARRAPRAGDSYRPEPRRFEDDRNRGQGFAGAAHSSGTERNFRYDADAIRFDLTKDLPEWPFSTYAGAGSVDPPKHFFNPIMEQSPEEIRAEYYLARLQGREGQAQLSERNAHEAALAEIESVRRDINGAIRKVVAAKREHPNRWDVIDEHRGSGNPNPFVPAPLPTQSSGLVQSPGFGQPPARGPDGNPFSQPAAAVQSPPFGQQPQFNQQSTGFGQPSQLGQQSAFGQPSQPTASGFGQPSQPAASPFGQPSQPAAGAFGQPSQPAANGFGRPSQLGQQNPFGQQPTPQASSGFGQESALGQRSAFGQPLMVAQGSAFGQPSALGASGGFNKPSTLDQPGPFAQKANPFGQQPSNGSSPFGQVNQQPVQTSPFGQPSAAPAQANPFGQTPQSPFGQPPGQNSGGFGQPPQQQQSTGGFGQPSGGFPQPTQTTQATRGFGGPAQQQNPFGSTQATNGMQQPSLQLNTSQPAMNGTYTTNPPSATPRDSDPPDEMFGGRKAEYEEAYKHVLTTGSFADGIMPEVAPLHNWVGFGPMEKKFQA